LPENGAVEDGSVRLNHSRSSSGSELLPVTPKQSYVSLTVLHYCRSIAQAGQGLVTAVFPGLAGAVTFVSANSSFWVKTKTQIS
jgi:hypothetical protein